MHQEVTEMPVMGILVNLSLGEVDHVRVNINEEKTFITDTVPTTRECVGDLSFVVFGPFIWLPYRCSYFFLCKVI